MIRDFEQQLLSPQELRFENLEDALMEIYHEGEMCEAIEPGALADWLPRMVQRSPGAMRTGRFWKPIPSRQASIIPASGRNIPGSRNRAA